jgi:hypothetical protein
VRVHYGEGRSVPRRPRAMRGCREEIREALAGVCAGHAVSGESDAARGTDAVVAAEGDRGQSASARIRTTPRRLGPWNVHTPPAWEPGELRHRPLMSTMGPHREGQKWPRRSADLLVRVRCAFYNGAFGHGFGHLFEATSNTVRQLSPAA